MINANLNNQNNALNNILEPNQNKLPGKKGWYWQWNNINFNCWRCGYDIENGTGYYDCQNIEDLEKNKTDWNTPELQETISLNLPNRKPFSYRLYCEVCSQFKGHDSDYRTNQQWRKDWDEEYWQRSKLFHANHKYEGEKLITLNRDQFYQGYQKFLETQKPQIEESKINIGLTPIEENQILRKLVSDLSQKVESLQQPQPKSYPIKDFLLSHSYLVQFNEKEVSGKQLTQAESAKLRRIYDLRYKTFSIIQKALERYYDTAFQGYPYQVAAMNGTRGVCGWIEDKIWQLLILIGEPNHLSYQNISNDYWVEK